MRWFLPKRSWLQFSLRTAVAWIVAVNVAAAAWFHWTWEMERAGDAVRIPDGTDFNDELLLGTLASFRLPGPVDQLDGFHGDDFQDYSFSVTHLSGGRIPNCFGPFTHDRWSRQVSRVRFHWKEGREQHGPTRLYFPRGHLFAEERWRYGKMHGSYQRWYPTGEKLLTGQFDHGQRHGQWTVWAQNGKQVADLHFDRGRSVGVWWLHFDPKPPRNGNESDTLAEDNQSQETVAGKHPQGTVDYRWEYAAGDVCRLTIDRRGGGNDRVIRRQYVQGERHGRQEHVDARGQVRFESHWQQGQPDGWWACYDEYGECVLNAEYQAHTDTATLIRVNGRKPVARPDMEADSNGIADDRNDDLLISVLYEMYSGVGWVELGKAGTKTSWLDAIRSVTDFAPSANVRRHLHHRSGLASEASLEWEGPGQGYLLEILLNATNTSIVAYGPLGLEVAPTDSLAELRRSREDVREAINQLDATSQRLARQVHDASFHADWRTLWHLLEVEFGRIGVPLRLRNAEAANAILDERAPVCINGLISNKICTLEERLELFLTILDWQCTAEGDGLTVGPAEAMARLR